MHFHLGLIQIILCIQVLFLHYSSLKHLHGLSQFRAYHNNMHFYLEIYPAIH